ncbi:sugar nucleotide-binding protein [Mesorhizobium atlanticum]
MSRPTPPPRSVSTALPSSPAKRRWPPPIRATSSCARPGSTAPSARTSSRRCCGSRPTATRIAVVADQWGNPTSALDIADAILHCGGEAGGRQEFRRLQHLSYGGRGRHQLERLCPSHPRHKPCVWWPARDRALDIATSDYPTRARRPQDSRLSSAGSANVFGWQAPHWRRRRSRSP